MFLKLRIIFTVVSAVFAAAVLPIGALFGFIWAIACAAAAAVFFFVMLLCKQEQEKRDPPTMDENTHENLPNEEEAPSDAQK